MENKSIKVSKISWRDAEKSMEPNEGLNKDVDDVGMHNWVSAAASTAAVSGMAVYRSSTTQKLCKQAFPVTC